MNMQYKSYRNDSLHLNDKSPFYWDHVVRYWWASELGAKLSVLDCATGKGYGAFVMSQQANKVVGIDLNEQSLSIAQKSFGEQTNLTFKKINVFNLEELGEKFDVVTAFEVIEHIDPNKTDDFLKSISRVLKPGGRLLISTPNHDVVTKSGVHIPDFHINNFKSVELKKILKKHFSEVVMLGQFRKRKGLSSLIFNCDVFNQRHILSKFMRKKNQIVSQESEDEHDVIKDQILSAEDFKLKPTEQIQSYSFSEKHYRQAGLTVAICSGAVQVPGTFK